jgi:hypothetical protein
MRLLLFCNEGDSLQILLNERYMPFLAYSIQPMEPSSSRFFCPKNDPFQEVARIDGVPYMNFMYH